MRPIGPERPIFRVGVGPFGPFWPRLTSWVVARSRGCHAFWMPAVPRALRTGPFTQQEAVGVGVTRKQLRGAAYRRLGSGIYRWVGLAEGPHLKLAAIARRMPAGAAFSGSTAAGLHGLDVASC